MPISKRLFYNEILPHCQNQDTNKMLSSFLACVQNDETCESSYFYSSPRIYVRMGRVGKHTINPGIRHKWVSKTSQGHVFSMCVRSVYQKVVLNVLK